MTNAPHDDFGGLRRDLPALLDRRRALQVLGGISLAGIVAACSSGSSQTTGTTSGSSSTSSDGTSTSSAAGSTTSVAPADTSVAPGSAIPSETAGPFPADGSNGPDVLGIDGVVRTDIRTSIGDRSGTAEGAPTTLQLTLVDAATGSPVVGAALYAWHCTAGGAYSIYEVTDQNYLRGVQVSDAAGRVTFTTVFPGCYRGRWPHVHFEVYDDVEAATGGGSPRRTSQLALPQADCEVVYRDAAYGDSAANLSVQSLASDNIFSDGWSDQLATVAEAGDGSYTVSLLVRI